LGNVEPAFVKLHKTNSVKLFLKFNIAIELSGLTFPMFSTKVKTVRCQS
jgi:hypothetical protein